MASAAAPSSSGAAAASGELRLPSYFPRVPKQCKDVAQTFFDCFSKEGAYTPDKPADVGRKALATCQAQLKAYEACCEKHLTGRQSEVWSAPQVYVAQAADARADARAGK